MLTFIHKSCMVFVTGQQNTLYHYVFSHLPIWNKNMSFLNILFLYCFIFLYFFYIPKRQHLLFKPDISFYRIVVLVGIRRSSWHNFLDCNPPSKIRGNKSRKYRDLEGRYNDKIGSNTYPKDVQYYHEKHINEIFIYRYLLLMLNI